MEKISIWLFAGLIALIMTTSTVASANATTTTIPDAKQTDPHPDISFPNKQQKQELEQHQGISHCMIPEGCNSPNHNQHNNHNNNHPHPILKCDNEHDSCIGFCSTSGDTTFCFTKKECEKFRSEHDDATKCKRTVIHD